MPKALFPSWDGGEAHLLQTLVAMKLPIDARHGMSVQREAQPAHGPPELLPRLRPLLLR